MGEQAAGSTGEKRQELVTLVISEGWSMRGNGPYKSASVGRGKKKGPTKRPCLLMFNSPRSQANYALTLTSTQARAIDVQEGRVTMTMHGRSRVTMCCPKTTRRTKREMGTMGGGASHDEARHVAFQNDA